MILRVLLKRDRCKTLLIVFVLGLLSVGVKVNPPPSILEREEKVSSFALFDELGGSSPMNHFLLLRKKDSFCALRFTSFRKENVTSKPGCSYDGQNFKTHAEYDWYFSQRADGRFIGEGVDSGHGKVNSAPGMSLGIPFLMDRGFYISKGDKIIKCGNIELPWYYPNMFQYKMNNKGWPLDMEVEHAPTKWQDISKVNALNSSIIWYGHRDYIPGKLSSTYISNTWVRVEDLPPFKPGSSKKWGRTLAGSPRLY